MVDAQLAVGAGAVGEDLLDGRDLLFDAQFGDLFADEVDQFAHQGAGGQLGLLAEVDHFAVETVAGGAPFVLVDQLFGEDTEGDVSLTQLPVPEHEGLTKCGDGDGLVDAGTEITDAKFQSWIEVMGAHVPPDLAGVGDAAGIGKSLDQALVGGAVGEDVGYSAAGEVFENDGAVAFEPGWLALPEGAAGAEGEEMGEHVAKDIHGVDGKVRILEADMNVHAEDQKTLGEQLHFFQDALIAREGRHLLFGPAAHGMGGGGGD